MSTGRHARKRAAKQAEKAAKAENQLIAEQEQLLKKEEAKKAVLEKQTESQRIATMRARFGGQAPQESGAIPSQPNKGGTARRWGEGLKNKFTTPHSLRGTTDPVKKTILGMVLGNDQGEQ